MFGLGFGEILIIFMVVLLFVGPKKLPELAKGVGRGIRDFQNALKGQGSDDTLNGPKEDPTKEKQS